jgi:hypothetical protein
MGAYAAMHLSPSGFPAKGVTEDIMQKTRSSRPRRSFDGKVLARMEAIARFLAAETTFRQALIWFALVIGVVFVISLAARGTYISANPIDYLFMTEQGWRLAQGQIPYRDFISPIGPVYYLLVDIVEHLASGDPAAYRLTGFIALLLFGPGLIWISYRRLPGKLAVFVALYFAMMPISPREMDGLFFDFSFLALYNTLSWPLIATVMLGALFPAAPVKSESPRSNARDAGLVLDGVAMGIAVVALLGIKITHGLVATGIVCIALLIRPGNRLSLLVALAIILASLVLGYACAGGLFHAYLADIALVGRANNLMERLQLKIHLFVYEGRVTFLMSLLAVWAIEKYRQYHPKKIGYADIVAAIVILLATYADTFNDNEDTPATMPLLFLLFWIVAGRVTLPLPEERRSAFRRMKTSLTALPFLLWAGLPLANDALAIPLHTVSVWLRPATPWPTDLPPDAPDLSRLKISASAARMANVPVKDDTPQQRYLASLREAVALLRQDHLDQSKIYETRFNNVLAWLLHAPSPRGVLAWLDPSRTFSETAHPAADTYLRDVDVLMISKLPYDLLWSNLFQSIYGGAIARDFTLTHDTDYWQIYQRHHSP